MSSLRLGIVAVAAVVVGTGGCENDLPVVDLPNDGGLDATRDASSDGGVASDAASDVASDARDATTD